MDFEFPSPIPNRQIPSQYQPLSPWAFFGLTILFSIPVVGFIFLIIFSFSDSNLCRRNFARSYWCALLVAIILVVAIVLFYLIIAAVFLGGIGVMASGY